MSKTYKHTVMLGAVGGPLAHRGVYVTTKGVESAAREIEDALADKRPLRLGTNLGTDGEPRSWDIFVPHEGMRVQVMGAKTERELIQESQDAEEAAKARSRITAGVA